jgi:hypothetical protein
MGLKGYRLWVMGQLDSTCSAPPRSPATPASSPGQTPPRRSGASCILKGTFETGFSLYGRKGGNHYGYQAPFSCGSGGVNAHRAPRLAELGRQRLHQRLAHRLDGAVQVDPFESKL